jgi:hypothetical protein
MKLTIDHQIVPDTRQKEIHYRPTEDDAERIIYYSKILVASGRGFERERLNKYQR